MSAFTVWKFTYMVEKVKESEGLSAEEIAARRDEVVRRMIATPPQSRPIRPKGGKPGRPIAS
jgi:hypothetical protein